MSISQHPTVLQGPGICHQGIERISAEGDHRLHWLGALDLNNAEFHEGYLLRESRSWKHNLLISQWRGQNMTIMTRPWEWLRVIDLKTSMLGSLWHPPRTVTAFRPQDMVASQYSEWLRWLVWIRTSDDIRMWADTWWVIRRCTWPLHGPSEVWSLELCYWVMLETLAWGLNISLEFNWYVSVYVYSIVMYSYIVLYVCIHTIRHYYVSV